jgi:broad specificity phosphatase PhoE
VTPSNPTSLFLLRHAEVEAKYQRVFGGRIDMDLSPRGHEQAAALARYVRRHQLHAVYASPMKRVQQTLAPIAGSLAAPPVICPELREVDFGDWTGLSWDEVFEKYRVSAFQWLAQLESAGIPNAECRSTFAARVEPCVRRILAAHHGQEVAIVCHGGVIRMILSLLLDLPLSKMAHFDIDYASITRVDIHAHKTEVQFLNHAPWQHEI